MAGKWHMRGHTPASPSERGSFWSKLVTVACAACVIPAPSRVQTSSGGVVDDASLAGIALEVEEISEYRLVSLDEAAELLRGPIRRRVLAAVDKQRCVYLGNGRRVPGVRNFRGGGE